MWRHKNWDQPVTVCTNVPIHAGHLHVTFLAARHHPSLVAETNHQTPPAFRAMVAGTGANRATEVRARRLSHRPSWTLASRTCWRLRLVTAEAKNKSHALLEVVCMTNYLFLSSNACDYQRKASFPCRLDPNSPPLTHSKSTKQ